MLKTKLHNFLKNFFGFIVLSIIIISLLLYMNLALRKNVLAATNITEDFSSATNLPTLNGTVLNSGSLVLGSEGVSLNEDFSSYSNGATPTGWTPGTSDWVIDNGTYSHLTNAYDDSRTFYTSDLKNGSIQVDVEALGGEQLAGVIFRAQDNQNYYIVSFSPLYDFIALSKMVGGSQTTIQNINENYDVSTFYTFNISFNGTSIVVSVNGVEKFNLTDSTFTNAGKMGFWRNGAGASFDNVQISSATYTTGYADSPTYAQGSNIQSVSATYTGTNLANANLYVSNDNGTNWLQLDNSSSINFPNAGTNFKFRIHLFNYSAAPTVDNLVITLNSGSVLSSSFVKNPDLIQLHTSSNGDNLSQIAANPSDISLYDTLTGVEFVQQTAIASVNGETIAYIPDGVGHRLLAYNLTTKTNQWERALGGFTETTPFIDNGVIYIGDYTPKMYAINQSTGAVLWSWDSADTISGTNIDKLGNILYFADYGYGGTTTLYALNTNTQTVAWSYNYTGTTFISFTLDKTNEIVYANVNSSIIAFNANDGSQIWSLDLGRGYITKQPVLVEDKLVVGADQGIVVLNRYSGEKIWEIAYVGAEQGIGAVPVVKDNIIYYPTKGDSKLYARNLDTGNLVWSQNLSSGTFSSPVLTDDGLIYLSFNDGAKAFDSTDGSLVWTSSQNSWNENNISIGRGYLMFTDPMGVADGNVYIYKIASGEYTSTDSLVINRDDREISSITLGGTASNNFKCTSSQLTVPGSGSVSLTYDSPKTGTVKPAGVIINELPSNAIRVCNPLNSSISITFDIGTSNYTDVLKDGVVMDRSLWSKNGNLLTITDTITTNNFTLTTIDTPTPTSTSTVTPTVTSTISSSITPTETPSPTDTPTITETIEPTITLTSTPSITPISSNENNSSTQNNSSNWLSSLTDLIGYGGVLSAALGICPAIWIFLLLYGIIFGFLLGDRKRGITVNGGDNNSVPGAKVSVKNSRTGQTLNTRSNIFGWFYMKLKEGSYTLTASKKSYETSRINLLVEKDGYIGSRVLMESNNTREEKFLLGSFFNLNPLVWVSVLAFLLSVINLFFIQNFYTYSLVIGTFIVWIVTSLAQRRLD